MLFYVEEVFYATIGIYQFQRFLFLADLNKRQIVEESRKD